MLHQATRPKILKDHPVQLPEYFQASQKLKHVNEGIIQIPLEHWQASGINHPARKPVPVSDHPHNTDIFPNLQSEPPLLLLCAVPSCSISSQGAEVGTSFSTFLPQEVTMSSFKAHLESGSELNCMCRDTHTEKTEQGEISTWLQECWDIAPKQD